MSNVIWLQAVRFRLGWKKLPQAKKDEIARVSREIFKLRDRVADDLEHLEPPDPGDKPLR